jgi:hypothetical protein
MRHDRSVCLSLLGDVAEMVLRRAAQRSERDISLAAHGATLLVRQPLYSITSCAHSRRRARWHVTEQLCVV